MDPVIPTGAPVITTVTYTDEPSIEARVLCLVDGYAAEVTHQVNIKRQEFNAHQINVFHPAAMEWHNVLAWGLEEVGRVPVHPEADTLVCLNIVNDIMWRQANLIMITSRCRQEEINIAEFAAKRMEHQRQLDDYLDQRATMYPDGTPDPFDQADYDDIPEVDRGQLISRETLEDTHTKLAGDL